MKNLFKSPYSIIGIVLGSLAILILTTDLRYKAKHFIKSLYAEDLGWQRNESTLADNTCRLELYSPQFKIDRIYSSMTGPASVHRFSLMPSSAPELVWLTGYSTEVVDTDMVKILDEAYLCHNNLDYSVSSYYQNWGIEEREGVFTPRMATITQGQTRIDLPKGFGIPLMSNQILTTATQALNLYDKELDTTVRHKITVDYVRASVLEAPLKPS